MDLKDFFKVIQEISGLNVVLDPAVKGSVSIYLNDVPWDQALAIVLNNNGLECQMQGNVLRIATLETLKTEAEARRADDSQSEDDFQESGGAQHQPGHYAAAAAGGVRNAIPRRLKAFISTIA